jgi:hypothetical protein
MQDSNSATLDRPTSNSAGLANVAVPACPPTYLLPPLSATGVMGRSA